MKTIFGILTGIWCFCVAAGTAPEETDLGRIQHLVESGRFQVEADKAYPSGGRMVDLFSNRGYLYVRDSVAEGFFPFFGQAYSALIGERGGIEFNSKMERRKLTVKGKRKNKRILYGFQVKGNQDIYDLLLDISAGGTCTTSVRSNRKSYISYSGRIAPLEEEKAEP